MSKLVRFAISFACGVALTLLACDLGESVVALL